VVGQQDLSAFFASRKTWMAVTSTAMTTETVMNAAELFTVEPIAK
jgi:hypothetical protein